MKRRCGASGVWRQRSRASCEGRANPLAGLGQYEGHTGHDFISHLFQNLGAGIALHLVSCYLRSPVTTPQTVRGVDTSDLLQDYSSLSSSQGHVEPIYIL